MKKPQCEHFSECGGCTYQNLPYEKQLALKEAQVKALLSPVINLEGIWDGIKASPEQFAYRNKMEFSFGDLYKDGPLALGMHKRGSFYDIAEVTNCQIVDKDYRKILATTLEHFRDAGCSFFHKLRHTGYLRHLLVRKGKRTGEILIDLVTTTQIDEVIGNGEEEMLKAYAKRLSELQLDGEIVGILHTKNDRVADIIADEGTDGVLDTDRLTIVLVHKNNAGIVDYAYTVSLAHGETFILNNIFNGDFVGILFKNHDG